MQHLRDILLVGAGGFAGSICRYLISAAITTVGGINAFPLATFSVNAAGSLLIGLVIAFTASGSLHLIAAVGFCGGFTTFSTFSVETLSMLRGGQIWNGIGYALSSVLTCVALVMLGLFIGSKLKAI